MAQLPPHRIWLHNGVLRAPEAPAAEEGGVLVVDGRITASEQSGEYVSLWIYTNPILR